MTPAAGPRILVLADVGQPVYHVGDEAMGIAAVRELRARGMRPFCLTRDPEHSRRHLPDAAGYVRTAEFPWPPAEREMLLMRLEHLLGGCERDADGAVRLTAGREEPEDPQGRELMRLVRETAGMYGVLIAGGGNLNSRYGWLLYERCALGLICARFGIPLVISGQTFGPVLTETDDAALARLLRTASLVGAREAHSAAWARDRGVPAVYGLDDAVDCPVPEDLGHARAVDPAAAAALEGLPERFLAATFAGLGERETRAAAELLDRLGERTGLPVVFIPHMGRPAAEAGGETGAAGIEGGAQGEAPTEDVVRGDGDVATHREIARCMSRPATVLPMLHVEQAILVQRRAQGVITSRYHPGVFASRVGQPVLGLAPEAFTSVRLGGALRHVGRQALCLPQPWLLGLIEAQTERPAEAGPEGASGAASSAFSAPDTAPDAVSDTVLDAVLDVAAEAFAAGRAPRTPRPDPDWSRGWWDAVADRLRTAGTAEPSVGDVVDPPAAEHALPEPARGLLSQLTALWEPESLARGVAEAERDRAYSWDALRIRERDEARERIRALEAEAAERAESAGRRWNAKRPRLPRPSWSRLRKRGR